MLGGFIADGPVADVVADSGLIEVVVVAAGRTFVAMTALGGNDGGVPAPNSQASTLPGGGSYVIAPCVE